MKSSWTYPKRHLPSVTMPVFGLAGGERKPPDARMSRQLFCSLIVCILMFGNVVHAQSTSEELVSAAMQRLHWAGLYVPDIEIIIGKDNVATVSGTVASDVVKSEIVETLQMTDGVRGVINRLVVTR